MRKTGHGSAFPSWRAAASWPNWSLRESPFLCMCVREQGGGGREGAVNGQLFPDMDGCHTAFQVCTPATDESPRFEVFEGDCIHVE